MKKQAIVCFGDSITQCAGFPEASRWTARLAFRLEADFPDQFDVYNKGIGGNTTTLALDRIQADVAPLRPAMVLIEFGINDAYVYPWCRTPRVSRNEFHTNLREIVRQVSQMGTPLLILNHPVTRRRNQHPQGNGKSLAHNLQPYNAIIRNLAQTQRIPLLDLPLLLRRHKVPMKSFHSEDGVHLSPAGNRIYAELIFNELKKTRLKKIATNASIR